MNRKIKKEESKSMSLKETINKFTNKEKLDFDRNILDKVAIIVDNQSHISYKFNNQFFEADIYEATKSVKKNLDQDLINEEVNLWLENMKKDAINFLIKRNLTDNEIEDIVNGKKEKCLVVNFLEKPYLKYGETNEDHWFSIETKVSIGINID